MKYLTPGYALEQQTDDLAGLPDSVLANVSPRAVERLRGALFRAQALRAMTPAVENLSGAVADAVVIKASRSRRALRGGFELHAYSRSGGFWCGSSSSVGIRGEVWISED